LEAGFYPASLSSTKFLNYYASRLNSVEVNYTFRSLASKKLLKDWIAATSPGFKFAVKAQPFLLHEIYIPMATISRPYFTLPSAGSCPLKRNQF
jgi:uncharacterized protein YecE (DUF72 family)